MAAPELETKSLAAGHKYAAALEQLGLDFDAIFWAYDEDIKRHVLVVVTDFADLKGPLEVSKKLFQAYNLAATPRAIDPFIVQLYSSKQPLGDELQYFAGSEWKGGKVVKSTGKRDSNSLFTIESFNKAGLVFQKNWVIAANRKRKRNVAELNRRWVRFARNVDALAA